MWPYRDWLIKALNSDMPFDEFTIEQIAGDMLSHATTEQIVVAGLKTSNYAEGGRLYDINLRARPEFREGRQDLSLFTVPSTKEGLKAVPFDQVVTFADATSSSAINRYARPRQVTISVNTATGEITEG